jgi:hypothetical protein
LQGAASGPAKPVPRLLLDLSRHAFGMTSKLEAPHGFDPDQH